jgi:hypothetical protein
MIRSGYFVANVRYEDLSSPGTPKHHLNFSITVLESGKLKYFQQVGCFVTKTHRVPTSTSLPLREERQLEII